MYFHVENAIPGNQTPYLHVRNAFPGSQTTYFHVENVFPNGQTTYFHTENAPASDEITYFHMESARRRSQTFPNAPKQSQKLPDAHRRSQRVPDGPKRFQTVPNGLKRSQTIPGARCSQISPDASRREQGANRKTRIHCSKHAVCAFSRRSQTFPDIPKRFQTRPRSQQQNENPLLQPRNLSFKAICNRAHARVPQ